MTIGCASVTGRVRVGRDAGFRACVRDRLIPLRTRFPGAEAVRVMPRGMVLAIRYRDRAAIDRAPACDGRFASREATGGLPDRFDGAVAHSVFRADDCASATA